MILLGQVCRADYPLEFFITYPDRGYEAVLVLERAVFGIGDGRVGFSLAARNIDRVLNSDAKFNWFFLEPATYLGEMQVERGT